MNTITPPLPDIVTTLLQPIIPVIIPIKKIRITHDIMLNVSFKDAIIRVGISLFISIVPVFTNTHLIIYLSPVVFYLFVSALTKFCIVKYMWRRYIKHQPAPVRSGYGNNPNYPEESN